jgi:hypothetical protein
MSLLYLIHEKFEINLQTSFLGTASEVMMWNEALIYFYFRSFFKFSNFCREVQEKITINKSVNLNGKSDSSHSLSLCERKLLRVYPPVFSRQAVESVSASVL